MSAESNYSVSLLEQEYVARSEVRTSIEEILAKHVARGGSVIELGSGLGFNLDPLSKDYRVLGVEGLPDAVMQASIRGVETIQADLEREMPLPASSWDAVLCIDVLEHLLNPLACIREAHRLLRPSGLYVVNVPNHFTLSSRVRIMLGQGMDAPKFFPTYNAWNYPHVRFFQLGSIRKALEEGGFDIIEDMSTRFISVPVLRKLPFLDGFTAKLAKRWPDLFCGGFFLVARRRG